MNLPSIEQVKEKDYFKWFSRNQLTILFIKAESEHRVDIINGIRDEWDRREKSNDRYLKKHDLKLENKIIMNKQQLKQLIKEYISEMSDISQNVESVTDEDWKTIESLLRRHDWWADMNDGGYSNWLRAQDEYNQIYRLFLKLYKVDSQRVLSLWKKYAPDGFKSPNELQEVKSQIKKYIVKEGLCDSKLNEVSMNINRNVNPADKEQGVVGYISHVIKCRSCGKPTNLLFKNAFGKESVGCCQSCVDMGLEEETIDGLEETIEFVKSLKTSLIEEAVYKGRSVKLNKPTRGDVKKFKVYVKDPKTGNIKKVNFGDPNMRIKKNNPNRRKSFRARHKCSQKKDKTTAGYWSCKKW